jgi:lysophospholipase L1-like esterase
VTVFLCGDSTVTDQPREPYGTWGQMLPRWFNDHVAIANNAESGETVKAFRFEHRWDKVMSNVKAGDYVFMQFGHNDLNKTGRNAMWPATDLQELWSNTYSPADTDYKKLLEDYANEVKAKGAIPVIVSPMTKLTMTTGKVNIAGLQGYPKAAVDAAKEAGVACIDLNAMSIEMDNALGADGAKKAYVEGLHSDSYGGYLFSRCIVEGIRQNHLDLAKYLADDAGSFDPSHPEPALADFKLPLEPRAPFGGGRRGRGTTAPASAPAR